MANPPCKHWYEGKVVRSEDNCPYCAVEHYKSEAESLRLTLNKAVISAGKRIAELENEMQLLRKCI